MDTNQYKTGTKAVSIVRESNWTRNSAAANPDRLYIFTDNTDRDSGSGIIDRSSDYYRKYGNGTDDLHYPTRTTAVVRGLPNALPVSTQQFFLMGASGNTGRWADSDFDAFKKTIDSEFGDIKKRIDGYVKEATDVPLTIIVPENGFVNGTISAITEERTPKLFKYLTKKVESLSEWVEKADRTVKLANYGITETSRNRLSMEYLSPESFDVARRRMFELAEGKSDVQVVLKAAPGKKAVEVMSTYTEESLNENTGKMEPDTMVYYNKELLDANGIEFMPEQNKEYRPEAFDVKPEDLSESMKEAVEGAVMAYLVQMPPARGYSYSPKQMASIRQAAMNVIAYVYDQAGARVEEEGIDRGDISYLCRSAAERLHDNWAAEMFSNGWKAGEEESRSEKTNPDLVPFAIASESHRNRFMMMADTAVRIYNSVLEQKQASTTIDRLIAKTRSRVNAGETTLTNSMEAFKALDNQDKEVVLTLAAAAVEKDRDLTVGVVEKMHLVRDEQIPSKRSAAYEEAFASLPEDIRKGALTSFDKDVSAKRIDKSLLQGIIEKKGFVLENDLTIARYDAKKERPSAAAERVAREVGGVSMLRSAGKYHFGNPFSFANYPGVSVVLPTVKDSVDAFRQWLTGAAYQDVEPDRLKWIRAEILSGDMMGKPLVYYTRRIPKPSGYGKEGYYSATKAPNHAHVVLEYVNNPVALQEAIEENTAREAARKAGRALPVAEREIAGWLDSLSAYELTNLLDKIEFPASAPASFDRAIDAINPVLDAGFGDRSAEDIKDALTGLFNSLDREVREFIYKEAQGMDLGEDMFVKTPFQVYTLGTSNRPQHEIEGLIPPDIDLVLDVRNFPFNKHNPHLSSTKLWPTLKKHGCKQVSSVKDLSCTPAYGDKSLYVEGSRDVVDYEKIINKPAFQTAFREKLLSAVRDGKKVLVISTEGNPEHSPRALVLGQLLAKAGISVGHIDTVSNSFGDRRGGRIRSQEELVSSVLGRYRITEGDFRDIVFTDSSANWRAPSSLKVEKMHEHDSAQSRLINGNWNYGREVEFFHAHGTPAEVAVSNVLNTDFTILFKGKNNTDVNRETERAAGIMRVRKESSLARNGEPQGKTKWQPFKGVAARIPSNPNELLNEGEAIKVANHIRGRIAKHVFYQNLRRPGSVNPDAVRLTVDGPDMPHLAVEYTDAGGQQLSFGFLNGHRNADLGEYNDNEAQNRSDSREDGGRRIGRDSNVARMLNAASGFSLDTPSGATQEHVNTFISNVFKHLMDGNNEVEFKRQDKKALDADIVVRSAFSIGEVRTNGDTGVAEAATNAALERGIKASVKADNLWTIHIENETMLGNAVHDEAMYKNRFHQGLREGVSDQQLAKTLWRHEVHAKEDERSMQSGLTDLQILTLVQMGFSNADVIEMISLAQSNDVVIPTEVIDNPDGIKVQSFADGLMDFIGMCAGYGVSVPGGDGLSSADIQSAYESTLDLVAEARTKGIGYITPNSGSYPELLRTWDGYEREFTQEEFNVTSTEVIRSGMSTLSAKESRPPVLWFKGNPRALEAATVAVCGEAFSHPDALRSAGTIGSTIAAEGVALVTSLHAHKLRKQDFARKYSRDYDRIRMEGDKPVRVRDDSQFRALIGALERGNPAVVFTPNSIDFSYDSDIVSRTVNAGGLVLSETPIGEYEGGEVERSRASRMSVASAGTALLLDSKDAKYEESPANMIKDARFGAYAVQYDKSVESPQAIEGNRAAIASGAAKGVLPGGSGIEDVAIEAKRHAKDSGVESYNEGLERAAREDKHPTMADFTVIRKGDRQVFLVGERLPEVRASIVDVYGDTARIVSPDRKEEVWKEFESENQVYGAGARVQDEPVYETQLFYVEGKLYSSLNVPATYPGMPPVNTRVEQRKMFLDFRNEMTLLQKRMQQSAGLPDAAPLAFDRSLYLVIKPNAVVVMEGEYERARVTLDRTGQISVRVNGTAAFDYADHRVEKDSIIREISGKIDKVAMEDLCKQLTDRLLGTSVEESDRYALADRDDLEEIGKRLEAGYDVLSKDNLDSMGYEILEGIRSGNLADTEGVPEIADAITTDDETSVTRTAAFAAISEQETALSKEMKALWKNENKAARDLDEAKENRKKVSESNASQDRQEDAEEIIKEKNSALTSVHAAIGRLNERIAMVRTFKHLLATAEHVKLSSTEKTGEGQKATLSVDGRRLDVTLRKFSAKTLEKAREEMQEIRENKRERYSRMQKLVRSVESRIGHEATAIATLLQRRRRVNEQAQELQPQKHTVIESASDTLDIIEKDGRQAYADKSGKVVGDFHDKVSKFTPGGYGIVCDGGKYNIVSQDGRTMMPQAVDTIGEPSEGCVVVKAGRLYNHFDLTKPGQFVSESWASNARKFHDGYAVIQGGPDDGEDKGKFNYVNKKGEVLLAKWADEASDFEDGKASVKYDGHLRNIDVNGRSVDSPK